MYDSIKLNRNRFDDNLISFDKDSHYKCLVKLITIMPFHLLHSSTSPSSPSS